MSALAERLFGIHTATSSDNGQRGTSGQSGCPVKTSDKSEVAVLFSGKFFTYGYRVSYGSDDYKNLRSNHTVSVGGPDSINVEVDYGTGRQKKNYGTKLGGPYYEDAQSYVWMAVYAYQPSFETDPRPFSGSINSTSSVSITVQDCTDSGGDDGDRLSHRELFTGSDSYAYSYDHTNSDSLAHTDTYDNANQYTYPDADGHADSDSDLHTDAHCRCYGDTYQHASAQQLPIRLYQ